MSDTTRLVRIDACDVPYRTMGHGPVVVCSELPLNPWVRFTSLQRHLAERHRVDVVDWRPFVGTAAAPAGSLLDTLAAATTRFLDGTGAASCVLVGSFMFGGVAMQVARLAPTRIAGLVLIGSLGLQRLPGSRLMRLITGLYRLPALPRMYQVPVFRGVWEWSDRAMLAHFRCNEMVSRRDLIRLEELYEQYATPRNDAAAWALLWCIRRMNYDALVPHLDEVRCPTLIVHGADDCWIAPADAARLHTLLPNARLAIVPGARHMPEIEAPDEVHAAIDAFLGELQETPAAPAMR